MLWHFTLHDNKHNVTINIQLQLLNCFYLQNRENAREGKESELKNRVSMRIKLGIYPHSMHKLASMGELLICYLNSTCIFTQP